MLWTGLLIGMHEKACHDFNVRILIGVGPWGFLGHSLWPSRHLPITPGISIGNLILGLQDKLHPTQTFARLQRSWNSIQVAPHWYRCIINLNLLIRDK